MGVYQDEIDNTIQPAIDKKTAELAENNVKLAFFESLAADVTVDQFHTAALAHGDAVVSDMGIDGDRSGITDEQIRTEVAGLITYCKVMNGTHSSVTSFKEHTVKGDDSSKKWTAGNLQADLDALISKKTTWAAKEVDATDITSYDVVAQPVD